MLGLLGGCNVQPNVTLITASRSFTENFAQAYSSITTGGDDVVVLANGAQGPSSLRHVLRIRTLWHPVNGAKPNSPAGSNAALHYFVFTGPAAITPGYIHYAGTGFVTVEHDKQVTTVAIRNAKLSRMESTGTLSDPLQTFQLSGDFKATLDGHEVNAVLADLSRTVPKNVASPTTAPAP